MTPQLTIAIPTFDRNAILRGHIERLLPQLGPAVEFIILDNASPNPVQHAIADLLLRNGSQSIHLIRHPTNIGSAANILRCLEICQTPWIWILGDDDQPVENAVQLALGAITRHTDCVMISFNGMRDAVSSEVLATGLEQFIDSMPDFGNATLISNNLIRADLLLPHIRTGHYLAYSMYPILACVLTYLASSEGRCCFVPERLVHWGSRSEWSRIVAAAGMGTLLDLPLKQPQRQRLARMLITAAGKYSSLAIHLLDQIGQTIDKSTARHLYQQAWVRLYHHERSLSKHIVRLIGSLTLAFPNLGRAMYHRYRSMRGYAKPIAFGDEMART